MLASLNAIRYKSSNATSMLNAASEYRFARVSSWSADFLFKLLMCLNLRVSGESWLLLTHGRPEIEDLLKIFLRECARIDKVGHRQASWLKENVWSKHGHLGSTDTCNVYFLECTLNTCFAMRSPSRSVLWIVPYKVSQSSCFHILSSTNPFCI